MRLLRFGAELTATGFFTGGMFFLPLAFALLGREIPRPAAPVPTPPAVVAHWQPPTGGGLAVANASDRGNDPVETGQDAAAPAPPDLRPSPRGTPLRPNFAELAAGRASLGTGGGRGGGMGGLTMYRPAGHDRPMRGTSGAPHPRLGPRCEPRVDGIEMLAPYDFQVERQLLDEYAHLRRARELVGWVGRHRDTSGVPDGVQVGGIPCGSPLHLAGIRNGDIVHTINGVPITGIPSALAAYRKLRRADVLDVSLTRHGRPVHMTYHLS